MHFLVVGAGLAGICVSRHLQKQGQRITLIDNGQNKSSVVAAGMINPIVFRRMTKSWRADAFIPYSTSFYTEMEAVLQTTFFHPITIRRFFSSLQERSFWEEKQDEPDYRAYLGQLTPRDLEFKLVTNPFGSGCVKGASYVETMPFISAAKKYFNATEKLLAETFEMEEFDPETLTYRTVCYDGVIFCEGYNSIQNPFFKDLPIHHTKGETITIHCPELQTDESFNRKCFVLPLGGNFYRVGATYIWNTSSDEITDSGRTELINKFNVLSSFSFDVTDQQAGIRPTTPDRRPLIGAHHKYKKVFVFNGLGTKGYMSAPLLASEFVAHVLHGKPLDSEVALNRFKKS
jgi:glycine oxidase